MAPPLTAAQRREKAAKALDLSAKGWTNIAIGEELEVSRQTASRLIADETARVADERPTQGIRSITAFEQVKREAWERLANMDSRSLNVSGLLNAIIAAEREIVRIAGVIAEQPDDPLENVVEAWKAAQEGEIT